MARHAASHGMNSELHVNTTLCERVVKLAHFVLCLSYGHAVARNDHHGVGRAKDRRCFFGCSRVNRAGLLCGGTGGLHLPERPKQNIRERTVHGL